jgi:hypothetical protein
MSICYKRLRVSVSCALLRHAIDSAAVNDLNLFGDWTPPQSAAVDGWSIETPRSINYRSLSPIVRLTSSGMPSVQYWASWALANLCTMYRMSQNATVDAVYH